MKKVLFVLFILSFLTACKSNFQSHDSIITNSKNHIDYVLGFEDAYDDFWIFKIEYVEDSEYMYYIIYYEGYYTIDVEILNVHIGDKLDSSSLCRNPIGSNTQECLNGADVTGSSDMSIKFHELMDDLNSSNYYLFEEQEITEIKE